MICYFQEDLQPSIQAQLDVRDRDLDSWHEVVDKTVNAEAKAHFQALSEIREIDSWCLWGQQPTKKDNKIPGTSKKISFLRILLLMRH